MAVQVETNSSSHLPTVIRELTSTRLFLRCATWKPSVNLFHVSLYDLNGIQTTKHTYQYNYQIHSTIIVKVNK